MVEGVRSARELDREKGHALVRLLRYDKHRLLQMRSDRFVPWAVVLEMMGMSDEELESLVAHSVHRHKGRRFETCDFDDQKFIRAKWSRWDPWTTEVAPTTEPPKPQMEASPPSPPSGPPLAAGDLDRFCEQLQELTQRLQELTQRCDAAQQENDKLRNQIGDMKKDIHRFKNWARVHVEEVVTAGVRCSSSNNSSNTWNGSNSWWTAGSGWDDGWCKDHSNVPWHVSK